MTSTVDNSSLEIANKLLQQGKIQEAVAEYRRGIELTPDLSWHHYYLGEALTQLEDWEGAVSAYRQAISLGSNYLCYYRLGVALVKLERWDEAIEVLNQGLELKPDYYKFYLPLGQALVHQQHWEPAMEAYRKAVALKPGVAEFNLQLGYLLRRHGRFQEAAGYLQRAVDFQGDDPQLQLALGVALVEGGTDLDRAEGCLRRSLELQPDQGEAYFYLGKLCQGRDQLQDALGFYRRCGELSPGVDSALAVAAVLEKLGRWTEAVDQYRQVVLEFGECGPASLGLGRALAELERPLEAVVEWRRAVKLGVETPEVHRLLADTLVELGRWSEVVEHWKWLLERYPGAVDWRRRLALALMGLGRWTEAAAQWGEYWRVAPGSGRCRVVDFRPQKKTHGEIDHSQELSITGDLTVEFWLYLRDWPKSWTDIISKFVSDEQNEFCFRLKDDQKGQWYYGKGDGYSTSINWVPQKDIRLHEWVHVACVRKVGEYGRIYFNGVLRREDDWSGESEAVGTEAPVRLMGSPQWQRFHDGKLSEVRLWNRARSGDEIREGMCEGLTGEEPGLVGLWHGDESDEGVLVDAVGHHHGRLVMAADAGKERPRVGVCGWELSHNAAGRAYTLAQLYGGFAEVELIGCLFPKYGGQVWEPIRGGEIRCHTIRVKNEGRFIEQALGLVLAHPYEVVHLSKPRMPNIILGLLYKLVWGARVIVDIDDEELIFVRASETLDLRELPPLRDLDSQEWTEMAVGLAREFDKVRELDGSESGELLAAVVAEVLAVPGCGVSRGLGWLLAGLPAVESVVLGLGKQNSDIEAIERLKTSIKIVIPSFNRHIFLRRLLANIDREADNYDISVDVFDDGSQDPVVENANDYPNLASLAVHRYNNYGKKQYWQLVNHIFNSLSKQNADLFIYMPDDIEICPGFFQKVVSQWYAISDPRKIVLNLGLDHRTQCWTGFERVKYQFGEVEVFKTQWVDMLMLFERSFLEALDYRIQPISLSLWQKNPNFSSGVGAQISKRLHGLGFSIYQVSEYLVSHGDHESMMNPEERKINPLTITYAGDRNKQQSSSQHINGKSVRLDKVVASLASIPDRLESLEVTVNVLYPQVDRLNVYLNNYPTVPSFLMREKIYVARSQVHGNLGDSGKFFWCEEIQGYHFTCDDDLAYPPDYIKTLIGKIEQYQKKAVIGVHGSIFRQPFNSYQEARNVFHCLHEVEEDTFVHHLGTGAMAYHTSTIEVVRNEFQHINMADIWFSLLAQKYKIPRIVIKHQEGWLQYNEIDMKQTIYHRSAPESPICNLSTRVIQDYVIKQTQPWRINYLPNKPIVVISSTAFNSKNTLEKFINSWEKTKSNKYHWILIIADNGSTDGTVEYLFSIKPYWQLTLIQKQGLSHAELVNAIFDECQNIDFDYGFYADNDVLFSKPGWDQLYINAIEKSGYAHLCHQNTEYFRKLVGNKKLSDSVLDRKEQIDTSGYCSTIMDASQYLGVTKFFTFNQQTIERVGYADASKFPSGKEWQVDILKRYSRAGFNDGNKYWDAKGSNEYLQIQGMVDDGDRLIAEYDKASASLLAKSQIIEHRQRIYVDKPTELNLSKQKDYDLNQYFDNIYLINLDSQINRWHQASEWAKKYGINLTRFLGVDGNALQHRKEWEDYARQGLVKLPADIKPIETTEEFYFNYQYDVARVAYIEQKSGKKGIPTPEAWGYLLSVIRVLEDAIAKGYQRILVLDDGVVPHQSIKSLFAQGIREAPEDWKIILLGAFQDVWDGYITPYSQHLYQSNGTSEGSFAMALDSSVFVPLLHYAKKFDVAFDLGALHRVQRKYKDKCFVFQPSVFSIHCVTEKNYLKNSKSYKIVCGLATIQERKEALKDTVESIIDKVDKLIVYQNGYKEKFDFLQNDKIEVISSLETGIDMGDAGKFYSIKNYPNCYYLSIDDDLIYPSDYVDTLISTLKKYDNKIIATFHGRTLKLNAKSYYEDILSAYRCLKDVNSEEFVHFGGTGVMAFHTNTVQISFEHFKHPNMADIWMGLYARENNIPILVVPHKSKWILHSDKFDLERTIFRKYKNKDYIHSELIKNFDASKIVKFGASLVKGETEVAAVGDQKPLPAAPSTCNDQESHPKNENAKNLKLKRVVFLSCTFGRIEVSKIYKQNLIDLQNSFYKKYTFKNVIIDSENSNRELFADDERFEYYNYSNQPLSNKFNFGCKMLREIDFDYVIILGSDDIIDNNVFMIYDENMAQNFDIIGMLDVYLFDLKNLKAYYWGGYPKESPRFGESIGMGRCLSKKIVENLNYQLWEDGLNKSLDYSMMKRIKSLPQDINISSNFFRIKGVGVACDIKSKNNITKVEKFLPTSQLITDQNLYNYMKNLIFHFY
ncbi:tetratricopeptide repeat protein [Limnospira fusiformis KN01]|uniref:tetratricopeptide repeat protein n=1 Tax=Limnospira fusiformis TaxID=54297 RepID=UPI0016588ACA|nr:tetratricopeptide repeat protein [Limnospira fusiformis]ULB45240.1 tetratricopeptide repeat protein [Limnospira fusiformis KN01]